MENNDQNLTPPAPQEENSQCDPTSADSSCCSAGSGGSKGFKTVILIVVLLLGAAVASRSLLQNTSKPSCCPGGGSGQCPKGLVKPDYDQAKTPAVTETKSQGCPLGEIPAGSPCCPSATASDALPKTCPKQSK